VSRGRPKQSKTKAKKNGNGANIGFEAELFLAADKLRKNFEPSDYKHVVLGLIFLRHMPMWCSKDDCATPLRG
jgi:type I restriction enzyme M protein